MQQLSAGKIQNILLITLSISFLIGPNMAQTKLRTVTDYYLALPSGIYGIKGIQDPEFQGFENDFLFYVNKRNESQSKIRKFRRSLIKIEDKTNGYLRLGSGKWNGWVEVDLFKKTDDNYLVAISQVECGPGCSGDLLLLAYNHGTWTNVTKQAFPSTPSSEVGYFKLPRVGKIIELICGGDSTEGCKDGQILAEFRWNKAKFIKEAVAR